jgi:hypothetical protein
MVAASPKTQQGQLRVELWTQLLPGVNKQRGGFLTLQIRAAMGKGGVDLNLS